MTFSEAMKEARSQPRLRRRHMSDSEKYEAKLGFAFISPWLIGFSIFYLVPMVASFVISLFDYDLASNEAVSYTHLTLPTNRVACRSRWSPYH